MQPYLIVDAHVDIAYNALTLGRDIKKSVAETRASEPENPAGSIATLGLPELLAGNVRIVFGTIYVSPDVAASSPGKKYKTAEEAEALALEQLTYYGLLATDPRISLVTVRRDLERIIASPEPKLGIVLLMEGADPIVSPSDVPRWFDAGVRIIGPSWSQTRYAGGTGKPGPLTELGRQLMTVLARSGLVLDTSHMAEESFFQALDLFDGKVIASHSNVRALVPSDRQLSDEMIRAIIERGGVIGTVFYNQFLQHEWRQSGGRKEDVGFSTVIRHMQHVCDIAGNAEHCGIGSDFDGGFGSEATPKEIDTCADLQRFGAALADAGFDDDDICRIMGGNWIRLLRQALPAE